MCEGDKTNNLAIASLPSTISVIVAGAFILSFCYDYGYIFSLDLNFSKIPTTISDHIRSALLWLPYVSIVVFISIVVALIYKPSMRLSDEVNFLKNEKYILIRKIFWPLGVLCTIFFLLFGSKFIILLTLPILLLWCEVLIWMMKENCFNIKMGFHIYTFLLVAPCLIFIMFSLGTRDAVIDISRKSIKNEGYEIALNNERDERVLRFFEHIFILYNSNSSKIIIRDYSGKDLMAYDRQYTYFNGYIDTLSKSK